MDVLEQEEFGQEGLNSIPAEFWNIRTIRISKFYDILAEFMKKLIFRESYYSQWNQYGRHHFNMGCSLWIASISMKLECIIHNHSIGGGA